jgi:hypothetical protein
MIFLEFHTLFNIFRLPRLTAANQLKQDVDCVIFGSEKTTESANQLQKFTNLNIKTMLHLKVYLVNLLHQFYLIYKRKIIIHTFLVVHQPLLKVFYHV